MRSYAILSLEYEIIMREKVEIVRLKIKIMRWFHNCDYEITVKAVTLRSEL